MKLLQDLYPYSKLQWTPNGWVKRSKLQFVLLDETPINLLVSFIALWSYNETVILTFNSLESIETNCMDTNPGMFSSKIGMLISVIFPSRQPTLVNRLLTVNRQDF